MKTFHLLLIIGIGITVSVVFGMYVVSLPPTPKITINPDTENQLEPIQYNQDTNNSDAIRQVWDYPVDGEVQSVAASYNASYVAAATRLQEGHADDDAHQGSVYLFDKNGNKLWQYESNRKIDSVLISGNGQYVIATGYQIAKGAAGTYENPAIYFFDKNGTMLWKKEMSGDGTIWRANISYNGSVVSTVSQDKALYLNKSGNLIWSISSKDLENSTARTNEQLFGVTMTPDGSMLAVRTSGDVFFVNSQGKILWKFPTQYEDGGWALISKNGKYVFTSSAANSEEGNAYLIDASNGSLLWKRQVGGPTLYAGMSDDGSYVALSTNWQVFIFDLAGNLLGQDNIPSLITMSSDGSFVGGIGWTPSEANMMLMDRSGKILSSYPLNAREVRSISLSGDSRYLAAGIGYRAQDSNKVGLYQLPVIAVAENTGTIPNNTESANSNSTHMSITFPNTKSEFYVTISQGDTVQIPWNLEIDRNYVPFNMELDINSSKMISSWIRPNLPFETVNGIPPDANKTITVSLSPDVTPGNYTLTVTGHGDTINNSTGWMTPLEGHLFATVHVTVQQEKNNISIKVTNSKEVQTEKFCFAGSPSGLNCESWPVRPYLFVTVYSDIPRQVKLDALNIHDGEWIKFVPSEIVAGPNGTAVRLYVAGYNIPYSQNQNTDKPLIIRAISSNETKNAMVPVTPGYISILRDPAPIKLDKIITNSDGGNMGISSAVYDPVDNSSATLPVTLSVLGLENGTQVSSMPSWLTIGIPHSSFDLNATEPYYFAINAKTNAAPLMGSYSVAIDENVGGRHFIQLEQVELVNTRY